MVCPQCNGSWDQKQNGCTSCGLAAAPQSTDVLIWNERVPQKPPWVQQLAADAQPGKILHRQPSPSHQPIAQTDDRARSLKPGTVLFNGRYRLYEREGQQIWLAGAFEATWLAQDAERGGAFVRICEFVLPAADSLVRQSTLRTATMALHRISRHAHIPTLLDVFNDYDRSFFVFEYIEGESLLARMCRIKRVLSEQDVVECCLQMTGVLEFLAQQSPPMVHGLIRPENILVGRTNTRYTPLNFSAMLAGGATQFVMGLPRLHLSRYTAPEFARGAMDGRCDIYSLLATAYALVTGSAPMKSNGNIIPARQFNSSITPQFEAILTKGLASGRGLRPDVTRRYQHPSELRQDLLRMHMVSSPLAPRNAPAKEEARQPQPAPPPPSPSPSVAVPVANIPVENHPILQTLASDINIGIEEPLSLLPRPEDLSPLAEENDAQQAIVYLVSMLACIVLVIFVGRGLI